MESQMKMHVGLNVSKLENTIAFYNKLFGREPDKVKPLYAKYMLDNPGLIISFIENEARVQPKFGHLGFRVNSKEELQERLQQVRESGLTVREELNTGCCYALQDKFWVTDPDGIEWEVYYFYHDIKAEDPGYQEHESNTCCTPGAAKTKTRDAQAACC